MKATPATLPTTPPTTAEVDTDDPEFESEPFAEDDAVDGAAPGGTPVPPATTAAESVEVDRNSVEVCEIEESVEVIGENA